MKYCHQTNLYEFTVILKSIFIEKGNPNVQFEGILGSQMRSEVKGETKHAHTHQ